MRALASWVVGNNRESAAFNEKLSESVAVVGGVGCTDGGRRQRRYEGFGSANVSKLSGRDFKSYRSAAAIDDRVDFRRATAARTANRLILRPPFPPAALR